jgi:hypothetical protein
MNENKKKSTKRFIAIQLTSAQKSIIEQVINCFKTAKPEGDYGCLSIYADKPNNIPQITFSSS